MVFFGPAGPKNTKKALFCSGTPFYPLIGALTDRHIKDLKVALLARIREAGEIVDTADQMLTRVEDQIKPFTSKAKSVEYSEMTQKSGSSKPAFSHSLKGWLEKPRDGGAEELPPDPLVFPATPGGHPWGPPLH